MSEPFRNIHAISKTESGYADLTLTQPLNWRAVLLGMSIERLKMAQRSIQGRQSSPLGFVRYPMWSEAIPCVYDDTPETPTVAVTLEPIAGVKTVWPTPSLTVPITLPN